MKNKYEIDQTVFCVDEKNGWPIIRKGIVKQIKKYDSSLMYSIEIGQWQSSYEENKIANTLREAKENLIKYVENLKEFN